MFDQVLFSFWKTVRSKLTLLWIFIGLIIISMPAVADYPGSIFFDPDFDRSIFLGRCSNLKTIACLFERGIRQNDEYEKFALIVREIGWMDKFDNETEQIEYTIFVPKSPSIDQQTLGNWIDSGDKRALKKFVNSHLVKGKITEEDVNNGYIENEANDRIQIIPKGNTLNLRIGDGRLVTTTQTGKNAGNGVVISIPHVLVEPKFER
jgi:uncharacterized surface protein with fasciclin (FAS1) repeats